MKIANEWGSEITKQKRDIKIYNGINKAYELYKLYI